MSNLKDDSVCCGVTTTQCHVLLELADLKTASITELRNYLVLDKSVVSRTVDTLVKQGLIVRSENPEDRRYSLLHLSNEGVKRVNDIDNACSGRYKAVLEKLPKHIQERIYEDLCALADAGALKPAVCGIEKPNEKQDKE